jgi:hypothetical protein
MPMTDTDTEPIGITSCRPRTPSTRTTSQTTEPIEIPTDVHDLPATEPVEIATDTHDLPATEPVEITTDTRDLPATEPVEIAATTEMAEPGRQR